MLKNTDVIIIDGKEYCVADSFSMDGNDYAYLFEVTNPKNVKFTKYINDMITEIDNEEEFKKVVKRINEDIVK